MRTKKLLLIIIYGDRLPGAGVVFLAPETRGGYIGKVHEAFYVCQNKYPRPERISAFKDRHVDGSLSKGEKEDKAWFETSKAWKGNKFIWSFRSGKFVKYREKS